MFKVEQIYLKTQKVSIMIIQSVGIFILQRTMAATTLTWYLQFITLNSFTDLMDSTIAMDTHSWVKGIHLWEGSTCASDRYSSETPQMGHNKCLSNLRFVAPWMDFLLLGPLLNVWEDEWKEKGLVYKDCVSNLFPDSLT